MLGLFFAVIVMGFMLEIKEVLLGEAIMTASRFLLYWYLFIIFVKIIYFIKQYIYHARLVINEYEKNGHKKKMTYKNSYYVVAYPVLFVCGAFLISKSVYPDLSMLGGYVYEYGKLILGIILLIIGVCLQILFTPITKEEDLFFKIEDIDSEKDR